LRHLEQRVPEPACPACRDRRGRIVMVDGRLRADGTPRQPDGRPAPCDRCGETPEFIIQIVETVVDGTAAHVGAGLYFGEPAAGGPSP
jgi:hypothetical protein